MSVTWSIFISLLGVFLYLTYIKIEFLKIRKDSKKIVAEIFEYRKEKGPMRNDYTQLEYPYVRIDSDNADEYSIRKLRYADNYKKHFYVGQKINVFWYNNDLLYWETYDNGIYKYIPSKWNFIR